MWTKEYEKEYMKEYMKTWYQTHRKERIAKIKEWQEKNKDKRKAYSKVYTNAYNKTDLNELGEPKYIIRNRSRLYLRKYGQKIEGYEIHHCCTYNEPYKFIYCSKEMHRLIHSYLKQHNIDADSDHYEYIKHLLDDTVIKYNVD